MFGAELVMSALITIKNGHPQLDKDFEDITQIFLNGMPIPKEGNHVEKEIQEHWIGKIYPMFLLNKVLERKMNN